METVRAWSKLGRTLLLAAILWALWFVSNHVPFPVTWLIHLSFAFILTVLVYKYLLDGSRTGPFLAAMVLLMVAWEVYEWGTGGRVEGSVLLTAVDTALDMVFGLLGTLAAIRASHRFAWL